jgi:hypothetical protein
MGVVETTITDFNNKIAEIARKTIAAQTEIDQWITNYTNNGHIYGDVTTGVNGQQTLVCVGKPGTLRFNLCDKERKNLDALGQKKIDLENERTATINNYAISLQLQGFTPDVAQQTALSAYQSAINLQSQQTESINIRKYYPYIIAAVILIIGIAFIYFKFKKK